MVYLKFCRNRLKHQYKKLLVKISAIRCHHIQPVSLRYLSRSSGMSAQNSLSVFLLTAISDKSQRFLNPHIYNNMHWRSDPRTILYFFSCPSLYGSYVAWCVSHKKWPIFAWPHRPRFHHPAIFCPMQKESNSISLDKS